MPDREKVIKGLECCLGANDCDVEPEEDCPYKGMCLCAMALRFDVLALLKEQDNCENCAIAIEDRQPVVRCKDCRHCTFFDGEQLADCMIKQGWFPVKQDWFCADGERKEGRQGK